MTKTAQSAQQILQALRAPTVPIEARADYLIYTVNEQGLDLRPAVISLLQEADEGRRLKAKAEEDAAVPLSSETFLGTTEHNGRVLAAVTSGASDLYLPCKADDVKDLECGDAVLIDPRNARIVGRDGSLPRTGDVVSVEIVPDDIPGQVVVRHHDQSVTARVAARLQGGDKGLAPGTRVVYDAPRRIVTHVLAGRSDGSELLTPLEALSKVSRKDLGAPHPVLEEMLFRLKMWATCPDWMKQMRARPRMSYLLTGPTGGGKTMHLKVLAAEIADLTEQLTGQRLSRLVMCNASQFYSPWFGQTEENITRWFDALSRLGGACLRTRDGREFRVPLLVVLEEAEALLRVRGDFGGSSHLFDRPLALILQRLDALTDELNVPLLFCSTSNRPDLIDPAARRRLGVTQVTFGTLNAAQAASVLDKKLPADMPLRGCGGGG
ncbi:MAG TPA: ATP-binding protein, partial [Gemmataceae bacterium]|nr:ATP-binding protein [Gemmataceae bacterium]